MSRRVLRSNAGAPPADPIDPVDPPAHRGRKAPKRGRVRVTAPASPRRPRQRKITEEKEEVDDIDEDDDDIEIQSDPGTPPRPKGKKKDISGKDLEWREMKKRDLTNPSIRQTSISPNAWPAAQAHLDFTEANWKEWARTLRNVTRSHPPLSLHLVDTPNPPDADLEPIARRNWDLNDGVVIAQIMLHISPAEQDFLESKSYHTSRQLYDLLYQRHTQLGVTAQVSLINDALSVSFSPKVRVSDTLRELRQYNDRIWAIGQPSSEAFLSILTLHCIRPIRDLRRDIENGLATIPNYGVDDITRRLQLYESEHQKDLPRSMFPHVSTANIATSSRNTSNPTRTQPREKCGNCKRSGHTTPYCVQPGGGCEGWTVEEATAKRTVDLALAKSKPNPSKPTTSVANIAQIVEVETTNLTTLTTDSIEDLVSSDADLKAWLDEAWMASHHTVGVDWANFKRDNVAADALVAAPISGRRFATLLEIIAWFLDSCASTHVSFERSDFYSLRPLSSPHVVRGIGGSLISAVGIGSIHLKISNDSILTLHNVLFIPSASARLISVSRLLDENNWHAVLTRDMAYLRNSSGITVATGSLHNSKRIYKLNLAGVPPAQARIADASGTDDAFIASRIPSIETWHRRLGHANNHAIIQLATKGLATGMPVDLSTMPGACDACVKGKQTRTHVPSVREGKRATEPLEKIFVDLTGPFDLSASKNLYAMDIVDDASAAPFALPTKSKAHAFELLTAWILRMQVKLKRKVGIVRIDNGELKSAKFEKFCASQGISIEYTAPYTSAHNGRVERMHRTLMSKARAMMADNDLPGNRWDELYITAAYLHIRTPSSTVPKTPYEMFWNKKPDLSHLREIGARAFVLKQTDKSKSGDQSFECVMVGYSQSAKAYRLYHRASHKVVESFHVDFIERKDDVSIPYKPGQIANAVDSNISSSSTFHDPILPSVSVSSKTSFVSSTVSSTSSPTDSNSHSLSPSTFSSLPVVDSFSGVPDSTVQTDSLDTLSPSSSGPSPSQPPLPKRVSKPSAKKRAAIDKQSALLTNISTFLSKLDAGNADAANDLAYAFDDLSKLPDVAYDDSVPGPGDPKTYKEAMDSPDAEHWVSSMQEELASLKKYDVYELVPRSAVPADRKVLKGQWVYRRKIDSNGNTTRYKSRYVFGGNRQVPGWDYDRTSAPTARAEAFRTLLSYAATNDWDTQQFDVKTAYLNGVLEPEDVQYMEQPKGFVEPGKETFVWMLKRSLYGMKQAGRIWNKTMNKEMLSWDFKRVPCEWCIYYRKTEAGIVFVGVHVDDFVSIGSTRDANDAFKTNLKGSFEISEGPLDLCLGIKLERDRESRTIALSQPTLIQHVIATFGQTEAHPALTPMADGALAVLRRPDPNEELSGEERVRLSSLPYRSLIGLLMYVAIGSRPDISFAISKLSQFLDCYRSHHWEAALRVVRYLKGTKNLRLILGGPSFYLQGFSDSSWAEEENRKSHMGYCFTVGSGVISWCSRRQATVAGSSTEAEYIAASEASREAVWLRSLLRELDLTPSSPTTILSGGDFKDGATQIFCDNNGAITLAFDQAFHARVKHIDVRYHFIREQVEANRVTMKRVCSADNVADIFTKPLAKPLFEKHRTRLGLA
jgi:hypothetical protein